VVKLNGSEKFSLFGSSAYGQDIIYVYDGYESEKKVINYFSGSLSSNIFNQQSSGQIMEIVFKRFARFVSKFNLFLLIFVFNQVISIMGKALVLKYFLILFSQIYKMKQMFNKKIMIFFNIV
jgi:hypothetical protein